MKIPALSAVVLTALMLVAPAGSAFPAGAKPKPRVWIVDTSPLKVAATGFGARERVTITLKASDAKYARTVRANGLGWAVAHWSGSIVVDGCHQVVATAVGARSGRQAEYASPKPKGGIECPQPPQPVDQ